MKHFLFAVGSILVLAFVAWMTANQSGKSNDTITPEETASLIESHDTSIVVLDVRTPDEFYSETGHLKGALLIPVQELEERMDEMEPFKGKRVIAYCRSGNRSGRATKMLTEKGFTAVNMIGGMLRWAEEKRPVEKSDAK